VVGVRVLVLAGAEIGGLTDADPRLRRLGAAARVKCAAEGLGRELGAGTLERRLARAGVRFGLA